MIRNLNNIKHILEVRQSSGVEDEITDSFISVGGFQVWEDTGIPVKYPILLNNTRKRKWVDNSYYKLYFNQIAEKYPQLVKFVSEKELPSWGYSWWAAGATGQIELYKENWDSSD